MKSITFPGAHGHELSGIIDSPPGTPKAWAIMAHCFTCGKDMPMAKTIASNLASHGIAVLRFDFAGLGGSMGDFARSNFSTNTADLFAAAAWLEAEYSAPSILIGHSLGGAAVLAAADQIPAIKAVATIAAPADPGHVRHLLTDAERDANEHGKGDIMLAGRKFTFHQQFFDDISQSSLEEIVPRLRCAKLFLHSPCDQTVGVDNASALFGLAKHPKSFVTLDNAKHLIPKKEDAEYVANMIASWAVRYLASQESEDSSEWVTAGETGANTLQLRISSGKHFIVADEPVNVGGSDTGMALYQLLLSSLCACSAMTVRMYADRKKIPLDNVTVRLRHTARKSGDGTHNIDHIDKILTLDGDLTKEEKSRLVEIASRCPVHRTLAGEIEIETQASAE
ncbi:MAG: bifunctional alpha/beta hydrolase/OsmC family protein [Alphaproteobacteria bacterium]